MAIDSALKRKSISSVAGVWMIPGITPDATEPQAWRATSGWGYGGIVPLVVTDPDDDDTKDSEGNTLTYTDYIDKDGAHIRVPRVEIGLAANSAMNSDLYAANVWDRTDPDSSEVTSHRIGRSDQVGSFHRLAAFSKRSGEAFCSREILFEYDEVEYEGRLTEDTTTRTDKDGAKMKVATWRNMFAMDTPLNSALQPSPATDQDAHYVQNMVDESKARGLIARVQNLTDGLAGSTGISHEILIDYDEVGPERVKARDIRWTKRRS